MQVLSQLGSWPAIVGVANAAALLILAISGVVRHFLNYGLTRRALKKKKPWKALRALAKVFEADQGKRRGDQKREDKPPKNLV